MPRKYVPKPRKRSIDALPVLARQTLWDTNVRPNLSAIAAMARKGRTEEYIAASLRVSKAILSEYKSHFQELRDALSWSVDQANMEIEDALFQRGKGIRYEEITEELVDCAAFEVKEVLTELPVEGGDPVPARVERYVLDPKTGIRKELRITKRVHKFLPPDTMAIMYWKNNREPADWKNRQNVEANVTFDLSRAMSEAEARVNRKQDGNHVETVDQGQSGGGEGEGEISATPKQTPLLPAGNPGEQPSE
jgi:hypothetical protein